MDPARIEDFQAHPYLRERCAETLVLTYAMHWPAQRETVRTSPDAVSPYAESKRRGPWRGSGLGTMAFSSLMALGRCIPFFHRPSWFEHAQAEQRAVRENVGLFDHSAGKLMVEGTDAEGFLQRVCTNDMALPVGGLTYSLMLNERGGIESDSRSPAMATQAYGDERNFTHPQGS